MISVIVSSASDPQQWWIARFISGSGCDRIRQAAKQLVERERKVSDSNVTSNAFRYDVLSADQVQVIFKVNATTMFGENATVQDPPAPISRQGIHEYVCIAL